MNAYELVLRVADELNISPNEALSGRSVGQRRILHYLNEGEMKTIARVRQPRIVVTIPSVAGTSIYSMGSATYSGEPDLPFSTWMGNSPRPPASNEQITFVRCMLSDGSYTEPLEWCPYEQLLEMGYNLSSPPSGTPQYFFLWMNPSEVAHPLQLGLYPAPNYANTNGIQLGYVPVPSNMRWLWGTGIQSETVTCTVTYGSDQVTLSGTGVADGLVDGLHFGAMKYMGEYPYHWYSITGTSRVVANQAHFATSEAYPSGNYVSGRWTGFDLDQTYQEQLDPAGGVYFVVCSPSTLGRIHPALAEAPAIYASAILLSQRGDKRNLELKAQWEGLIREFRAGQHRGHDFTGRG